jgi:8-oxo-dGTP pyrophosphatase MutT (NUDIX family)
MRIVHNGQNGKISSPAPFRAIVTPVGSDAKSILDGYQPLSETEAADVGRIRAISGDPWLRDIPLHLTASALIVHPPTGRVLLRWHERQQAWLQVGGHADPGEGDPVAIALREAAEETGLTDLSPWPDASLRHAVIVPVPPREGPPGKGEPAHQHADLRYFFATGDPDGARPETPAARLRWLALPEARGFVATDNLRDTLDRLNLDAGTPAR